MKRKARQDFKIKQEIFRDYFTLGLSKMAFFTQLQSKNPQYSLQI